MELDTSERAPSLAEVIRRALAQHAAEMRVSIPAVVTHYDSGKQMASVKPLVKDAYLDEEDQRQVESMPVIPGVPVVFPGAGGYRVTFPVCDGTTAVDGGAVPPATTGLLVFSDRSLDRWLSGQGQEVDPEVDHEHALPDAVFIPGLNPFGRPLGSCPADHATAGADAGPQVHFRHDHVCVGDEANSDWVALAQKVATQLQNLQTHFAAMEGVISKSVINEPGNGSPSAFQAALLTALNLNPYPTPSSVAASQAKAT